MQHSLQPYAIPALKTVSGKWDSVQESTLSL